jgi:metal iron transporter
VALSIILPFITAPLIYFTSCDKYITVQNGSAQWRTAERHDEITEDEVVGQGVKMTNSWYTTSIAVLIWLFMAVMNVANLVFLGN